MTDIADEFIYVVKDIVRSTPKFSIKIDLMLYFDKE